jgi:hypothetical protein
MTLIMFVVILVEVALVIVAVQQRASKSPIGYHDDGERRPYPYVGEDRTMSAAKGILNVSFISKDNCY